jgi:hypothetical protein
VIRSKRPAADTVRRSRGEAAHPADLIAADILTEPAPPDQPPAR